MKVKVYQTDASLPHQIIIMTGRTTNESAVSCNCRRIGRNGAVQPMGYAVNQEGALQKLLDIYNNPAKHGLEVCMQFPFRPEIAYSDKVEVEV